MINKKHLMQNLSPHCLPSDLKETNAVGIGPVADHMLELWEELRMLRSSNGRQREGLLELNKRVSTLQMRQEPDTTNNVLAEIQQMQKAAALEKKAEDVDVVWVVLNPESLGGGPKVFDTSLSAHEYCNERPGRTWFKREVQG